MKPVHVVVLPLAWAPVTLASFYWWQGDEYGLWLSTALPGLWVMLLMANSGDIHDFWNVIGPFLLAGLVTLTLAGLALDYLRVRLRWWLGTVVVAAPLLFFMSLSRYPTIERAVAKNGSLMAYGLSALGLAMCIGTVVALVRGAIARRDQRGAAAGLNGPRPA